MATTRSDQQVVKVFISQAEMATMLGNRAQAAAIITFAPEAVDLLPSEETDNTDPNNPITTPGWEVTFVRTTP